MIMLLSALTLVACTAAMADRREISYDDGGTDKTTVIGLYANGLTYHQRVSFTLPRVDGLANVRLSLHAHVGSKLEPAPGESELKVGLRVNGGEWHWKALKPYMDDQKHWIDFDVPAQGWKQGLNTVETNSTVSSPGNMTEQSIDIMGSGTGRTHYRSDHTYDFETYQTMGDRNWGIRLSYDVTPLPTGAIASLEILPKSPRVAVDAGAQFAVVARDRDGREVDPGGIEWTVSRGAIDEGGFFHAMSDGNVTIQAKAGGAAAKTACEAYMKIPAGVEPPDSKRRLRAALPEGHIDLRGAWQFRADRDGVGEKESWFDDATGEWGSIYVPGSWQAQGWGLDYHGIGWYRRTFDVPKGWDGREVRIRFAAVATRAKVWVNGELAGEHLGNWSPFDLDITKMLRRGQANTLAVMVQELPHHASAGFPMVVGMHFGGIWQNVSLYSTGSARISDLAAFGSLERRVVEIEVDLSDLGGLVLRDGKRVPKHSSTSASATAPRYVALRQAQDDYSGLAGSDPARLAGSGRAGLAGFDRSGLAGSGPDSAGANGRLVCVVTSPDGKEIARREERLPLLRDEKLVPKHNLLIAISEPKAWTPESPALYTARVELYADGKLSDTRQVRFGMRDVVTKGHQLLFNGEPISVRGVLHWANYHSLVSIDPSDEQIRKEFADVRAAGFNLIKVCLFMMPERFYEIADETGMMIWQEYPTWQSFPQSGTTDAHDALAKEFEEWVRMDRSHPSVILRDLTCESPKPDPAFMERVFTMVKSMTRGAVVEGNSAYIDPNWTDFYDGHLYREVDVQFNDLANHIVPHLRAQKPVKPYITGEDMDCDTYRDVAGLRSKLAGEGELPWWLNVPTFHLQETMEKRFIATYGADMPGKMVERQLRHARIARKALFEEYRRFPELTGYVMTHIFDNPLTRPGFYDDLGRPKWKPEQWRPFNEDRILMLYSQRRSLCFGVDEKAEFTVELSNFDRSITNAPLKWRLVDGSRMLAEGKVMVSAERGMVSNVAQLSLQLPELAGISKPMACRLVAELSIGSESVRNSWPVWLFPAEQKLAKPSVTAYSAKHADAFAKWLSGMADVAPMASEVGEKLIVTDCLNQRMVSALEAGAKVVYLAGEDEAIPRRDSPFWREMAVWLPTGHAALGDFPHEDFVDLQFVDMTQRRPFALTGFRDEVTPIVWGINARFQDKAFADYVFEAGVGKGKLLASCFRTEGEGNVAGRHLVRNLVRYAASLEFRPKAVPTNSKLLELLNGGGTGNDKH